MLLVHGADLELHVGPAPSVTAPVHGRATDALAGQERAKASHRQRVLRRVVADGERVTRGVLHEVVAYHEAELVAHDWHRKILLRTADRSALERDPHEPCLGQLLRQDAAGPAKANDDGINFFQFCRHLAPPQLMSAMLTGSAGNGLSRYLSTFSRCTAITPGKPISRQPALLRSPPEIGSENIPSITV